MITYIVVQADPQWQPRRDALCSALHDGLLRRSRCLHLVFDSLVCANDKFYDIQVSIVVAILGRQIC